MRDIKRNAFDQDDFYIVKLGMKNVADKRLDIDLELTGIFF